MCRATRLIIISSAMDFTTLLFWITVIAPIICAASNDTEKPIELFARTLDVTLVGKVMTSDGPNNASIYCFQNLKYAEEPIRFKPPVALKKPYYEEEKIFANEMPEKCPQPNLLEIGSVLGSEDCLFLNVYTPVMPNDEGNFEELYPVMIFLHGGGFLIGDSSMYPPTTLLDQKVLLVVPNYRLGALGFFSTMDERAPGNIALYDQQMAMKWVQEHIESFGGNKSRVTIFGQSAGSVSVNYHLIIPSSKGLMQNAICQSGSSLDFWALDKTPLDSAHALAKVIGCEVSDVSHIDEVYKCMIEASIETLVMGLVKLSSHDRLKGLFGSKGLAPIIQNTSMDLRKWNSEILITKSPSEYYKNLKTDVNLMIGANKHEGSFVLGQMYGSYLVPNNFSDNKKYLSEDLLHDILFLCGIEEPTHSLSESLAKYYLQGADRSDFISSMPGLIDLSGVLFMKAGAMETARLHSNHKNTGVNTFLYSFDYENEFEGRDSLFQSVDVPDHYLKGVTHTVENFYLFAWPMGENETSSTIRQGLVKLWTNFAIYGRPTPENEDEWRLVEIPIEEWKNYDTNDSYYLLIDQKAFSRQQQYSNRWTIANDEKRGIASMASGLKTEEELNSECNSLEKSSIYLTTTIVFGSLFVIAAVGCGYLFYMKTRSNTEEINQEVAMS